MTETASIYEELTEINKCLDRIGWRVQQLRIELGTTVDTSKTTVTARMIQEMACAAAGVSMAAMLGQSRMVPVVDARWIAILLIEEFMPISTTQVAELFMLRDHSTICNARKRGKERLKVMREFKANYESVKLSVQARLFPVKGGM